MAERDHAEQEAETLDQPRLLTGPGSDPKVIGRMLSIKPIAHSHTPSHFSLPPFQWSLFHMLVFHNGTIIAELKRYKRLKYRAIKEYTWMWEPPHNCWVVR